jgi:DNA-binding response OmpR family regulator
MATLRNEHSPVRQILLIDDDEVMADMLAEYLRPDGFVVHRAYTAKAGLERAAERGIVLIILDVMLPDRDGFSVLQAIRQQSRIPVIMLTTRGSVGDKVSGLEAGADDYIPKPFYADRAAGPDSHGPAPWPTEAFWLPFPHRG